MLATLIDALNAWGDTLFPILFGSAIGALVGAIGHATDCVRGIS